jgi:hypothetical protein
MRTTITLPPALLAAAEPRWKALDYRGFSAYVEQLIWQDLRERPKHVRVREEPANVEIKRLADEMMKPRAGKR